MLAVFVIWGLDTQGDAENPVFNLCWERRKRVGGFLNLVNMKKLSFEKFNSSKMNSNSLKLVSGGDYSTPGGSVTMDNVATNGTVYSSCTVSWSGDTGREGVGVVSYQNETLACG
jgi:hypothetical protein